MNVLALDTATAACSVALRVGEDTFIEHHILPRQQSERLLVLVDALLKKANISLKELNLIACGVGPGSFMGCRLAVSVAQGLAFGADLPVLPVSTLQVLSQAHAHLSGSVLAAWDARMGQIYLGKYRPNDQHIMQLVGEEQLVSPESLIVDSSNVWHAVGNAWQVYADFFPSGLLDQFDQVTSDSYPQAEYMLTIAAAAPASAYIMPELLAPTYLRRPVS